MCLFLLLLLLAAAAIALFIRHHYSRWSRTNIPHEKPHIPFGSLDALRRRERSFGLVLHDIYMQSKEKLVGIYLIFRPAILVRDAEIVHQMMTSDFGSFHDRGLYVDEERDPFSANLFSLRGQAWKTLRGKLTPSFSTGKLKGMFGVIDDVGDKLVKHLNARLEGQESELMDMQTILRTYAVDVIGSVIFGLDIDSFANPENEFRAISNWMNRRKNIIESIQAMALVLCPPIAKVLRRLGCVNPVMPALKDIVTRTIEFREKNKVIRKDLMQLLIQLRNTGKISEDDDKIWDVETSAESLKSMSIEVIVAQAFLFYIAGSESTAATVAFTLYELAMNPELLRRAEVEVAQCLEKHNLKPTDKFTYEAVQDMKFMDLCVMETIRKHPGIAFLNRECTEDYQVPGTDYTIAKGTPIIISLFGLHRDPEYFPNPLKYDPERFTEEHHNYNPKAYMPFGEGPRQCIAQRMGKVNTKVALSKILSNFNIESVEPHEIEFVFDAGPMLKPKDGLNLRLSKKIL